jgi:hypothetical protein
VCFQSDRSLSYTFCTLSMDSESAKPVVLILSLSLKKFKKSFKCRSTKSALAREPGVMFWETGKPTVRIASNHSPREPALPHR